MPYTTTDVGKQAGSNMYVLARGLGIFPAATTFLGRKKVAFLLCEVSGERAQELYVASRLVPQFGKEIPYFGKKATFIRKICELPHQHEIA